MSKGYGKIEKAIAEGILLAKFGAHPMPIMIRSWGLACEFSRDRSGIFNTPTRAVRKAVVRAMHSFVRKNPAYALMGGQGRKCLFLYELGDPVSAAWTKANVESREPVAIVDLPPEIKALRPNRPAMAPKSPPERVLAPPRYICLCPTNRTKRKPLSAPNRRRSLPPPRALPSVA